MARKPRIHFPGALYLVILRGNAQQDIFFEDADRCRFFLLIQKGLERFDHRMVAFCLMTNHVHLAIQVGNVPLSRIMQNLTFRYTRWINWRKKRVGHLFQGRYKAVMVDTDTYITELTAYLHLNPVRAGIVDKPDEYQWSSHQAYIGAVQISWLNTDHLLAQFSDDRNNARVLFEEYVGSRGSQGHREEFYGKESQDSRVIGEDGFVEQILEQADALPLKKPGLEVVLGEIRQIYGLTDSDLATPGQKRIPSEARSMAAWAVNELSDATLVELAERLRREPSTMSAAVKRFDERMKTDTGVAEKVEQLRQGCKFHSFRPE